MDAFVSVSMESIDQHVQAFLRGTCSGEAETIERLRRHHPCFRDTTERAEACAPVDARFVIARENGYPSWRAFVETLQMIDATPVGWQEALLRSAGSEHLHIARSILAMAPEIGAADIYCAAIMGDAPRVREFLREDLALVGTRGGPFNVEPLLYATHSRFLRVDPVRASGIAAVTRTLIEAGADVNVFFNPHNRYSRGNQTPLFGASGIGNSPEITAMLLEAGASPDDEVALYHASEFPDAHSLRLILAAGPAKSSVDKHLGRAIECAAPPAMMAFLQSGADPNYADVAYAGRTHLHAAIQLGRPRAILEEMLRRGADLEKPDELGLTAYRYAVRFAHAADQQLLRSAGADTTKADDSDYFIGACIRGDADAARTMLAQKPELRSVLQDRRHHALVFAASEGMVEPTRIMLELGFFIDAPLPEGATPLHRACWRGHLAVTELLVEHGASLTARDDFYGNALDNAIDGSVHNSADGGVTIRLPEEVPPREYAEIVDLLLRKGAKLPDRLQGSEHVIDVMVQHGLVE